MAIQDPNPFYSDMLDRWKFCRDSYEGAYEIKQKGAIYLPPTDGMRLDGYPVKDTRGWHDYQAYRNRAYYPEIYTEAVEASVGIMHREPAVIELPSGMQDMLDNATPLGESLQTVLRNINTQQLMTGRLGLLGDIRVNDGNPRPVVLIYKDVMVRNWDDTDAEREEAALKLVVLDESNYYMDPGSFAWEYKNKYRLLALVNDGQLSNVGTYTTGLFDQDAGISLSAMEAPNVRGTTSEVIPFSFINAKDIASTPDKPPLEGLADLCKVIYQGEADYRQNLHMQSQDTLVTIGGASGNNGEEETRLGTGAKINVPMGGDAKFIGVSSNGLPEQRQALSNDYTRAYQKAGQLVSSSESSNESGVALQIRVAAQTASYPVIAKAGAAGLERVLKTMATWMGQNPDDVVVKPNLKFTKEDLNGQTLVQILQSKGLGLKLSNESIHEYMREKGYTKKSFEDEQAAIEGEVV